MVYEIIMYIMDVWLSLPLVSLLDSMLKKISI